MKRHNRVRCGLLLFMTVLLLGCSSMPGARTIPASRNSAAEKAGCRDNTPQIRLPQADGTNLYRNDSVSIDASHLADGYVMLSCEPLDSKVKLRITGPDDITYTYDLKTDGRYDTFPLSAGNGTYQAQIYENIVDDKYALLFSQELSVTLRNEFTPFLYPNQFVDYDHDTLAVKKAAELAASADTDLEALTSIYDYAVNNITYDHRKAETVQGDYLPDIDDTLKTGTGICFDYAALMACMLRTQGIPTKLQIGYAGDIYHAWISCYLAETGWVDNIIHFDGKEWTLMDPTFAADAKEHSSSREFIKNEQNYTVKYSR